MSRRVTHRYIYASNNPLTWIDPTGRQDELSFKDFESNLKTQQTGLRKLRSQIARQRQHPSGQVNVDLLAAEAGASSALSQNVVRYKYTTKLYSYYTLDGMSVDRDKMIGILQQVTVTENSKTAWWLGKPGRYSWIFNEILLRETVDNTQEWVLLDEYTHAAADLVDSALQESEEKAHFLSFWLKDLKIAYSYRQRAKVRLATFQRTGDRRAYADASAAYDRFIETWTGDSLGEEFQGRKALAKELLGIRVNYYKPVSFREFQR